MVLKFYVLLGHHTKLTHTKLCDKICHICELWGKMSVPDIKNLGLYTNMAIIPRNIYSLVDNPHPKTAKTRIKLYHLHIIRTERFTVSQVQNHAYRISPSISREIYPRFFRTKYYTDNSSYTRVTSSGKKLYRKQVESGAP